MEGNRREPEPTRACISTGDAGRILQCLPITVRRRIERGELEGGQKLNGKWYVYADQVPGASLAAARSSLGRKATRAASEETLAREVNELRAQLAELRAERAEERARNAELEAERAKEQARNAKNQSLQLGSAILAMTEVLGEFQQGTERLQSGSARLSNVVNALLETITAASTPDSPEGI